MLDFSSLMTIAAAFVIAAASPGPATLAVATVSMNSGRKTGLLFGLGLSIGLAIWGLVAATGVGALLQASSYALSLLKLLGGAYLLWLAFNSARSAAREAGTQVDMTAERRDFKLGLLLNLSNPKAVFAWMAVLAFGIGDGGEASHVALATGLCMVLGFLIYASYAFLFSTSGAMTFYRGTRRLIEGVAAGLFALAGLGLIRSAIIR